MIVTVSSSTGKKRIIVPESWDEVTTDQYQKFHTEWDAENIVQLFSILTNEPYKEIYDSTNKELESALYSCVAFVYETQFKFREVPREITLNGRTMKIPKNVGALSIGQNIHVRSKLETCKVIDEAISIAMAVYLQPQYDCAPFDFDRAMELHEDILKLPITETYPVGFFLLNQALTNGLSFSNRVSRTITRFFRLMLKSVRTLLTWRKHQDSNLLNT